MWPFAKDRTEDLVAAIDRHGDKVVRAAKIRAGWVKRPLPAPPAPPLPPKPHEVAFAAWNAKQNADAQGHFLGMFEIACGVRPENGQYTVSTCRFLLHERGAPLP